MSSSHNLLPYLEPFRLLFDHCIIFSLQSLALISSLMAPLVFPPHFSLIPLEPRIRLTLWQEITSFLDFGLMILLIVGSTSIQIQSTELIQMNSNSESKLHSSTFVIPHESHFFCWDFHFSFPFLILSSLVWSHFEVEIWIFQAILGDFSQALLLFRSLKSLSWHFFLCLQPALLSLIYLIDGALEEGEAFRLNWLFCLMTLL